MMNRWITIINKKHFATCRVAMVTPILIRQSHRILRTYTYFRSSANRDLTIRQRRRPWKHRWKTDFASFKTSSRLSQFALLLKRRELWLELKRGDRARVQTEMVEFIALPFPFSSKIKIWSFHVVIVQGQQRNEQKSVTYVQSCCCAH